MESWTSGKIAELIGGKLSGDLELPVQGCCLDSRLIHGGEIFFALPGEKTDGYLYIEKAWAHGAPLAVASTESFAGKPLTVPAGKALILVAHPLAALQKLARYRRKALAVRVVGLTGSSGKTTTKDMLAAVLAQGYRVYKSQGNHNNELGLPLTILNAPADTQILILEMGMRGLNEIKALCDIACPDLAVITNIGTTHIELLGSQENIASAKWELVEGLPPGGAVILNAEDEWSVRKSGNDSHQHYFYGIAGKWHVPDLKGLELRTKNTGKLSLGTVFKAAGMGERAEVQLPLPGEHHVLDALAALATGLICGVSLREGAAGLADFERSAMRMEMLKGIYESLLISDVYNANPAAMVASIGVLTEYARGKKTLALLGDMYELGSESVSGHRQVGEAVLRQGVSCLMTLGPMAAGIAAGALEAGMTREKVHCYTNKEEMIRGAKVFLQENPGVWVLIKGSRGMRMEDVTAGLSIENSGKGKNAQ